MSEVKKKIKRLFSEMADDVIGKVEEGAEPEKVMEIRWWGIINISLAAILAIIPFFIPELSIAWFFAVGIIFLQFLPSMSARVTGLIFIIVYFVATVAVGYYLPFLDVMVLFFGINMVAFGPVLATAVLISVISVGGIVTGLRKEMYSHISLIIIAFAAILSGLDVVLYYAVYMDWTGTITIFLAHFAIYLFAITLSYAIFYSLTKVLKFGLTYITKAE